MSHYFDKLTQGAIGHILEGTKIEEPILQLLAYKPMSTDNTQRMRLLLSDGVYSYQCCIVMGDQAARVESGDIDRFCLLKLARYMTNEAQGRQVIVIADLQVIVRGAQVKQKLGDPVPFGAENAPPLSQFKPNYHLTARKLTSMEDEFGDDPFGDIDSVPNSRLAPNMQASTPKRMKNNRGQAVSSQSSSQLNLELACPIASITPYSNKWLIKGRVTTKTNKRSWSNAKGEGTLFSFDIKDSSGDIRITAFRGECEKYFDLIKVDDIYLVSRGQIKQANRQYTKTTSDYEITLSSDSQIQRCEDETNCPVITYDFKPFDQLDERHFGGFVDIIGLIKEISDVDTIVTKRTNKESVKRNLTLVDQTSCEIVITIWGEQATDFAGQLEDVIVVRGVKVSDFNNVSLSTTTNSNIEINPSLDEVHSLKGWYMRVKDDLKTTCLTDKRSGVFKADWNSLAEVKLENCQTETGMVLQTKATIYQMGKPTIYKACDCNKKLVDLNNGLYRCDKCQKEVEAFNWRMILSFAIADHLKNIWVQAFHEDAMKMLGNHTSEQLGQIYENNPNELDEILRSVNFSSFIFKLRSKVEYFNDESRIRTTVAGVAPINYKEYINHMLTKIRDPQ